MVAASREYPGGAEATGIAVADCSDVDLIPEPWDTADWRAPYEERAAILEYDGGLPKDEAEARAFEFCVSEISQIVMITSADALRSPYEGKMKNALVQSRNGVLTGTTERNDISTRFQPGNKLSKGRPPGSRNRMSEVFIGELCRDFEQHGRDVIENVRQHNPVTYLAIIAKLVPRDFVAAGDKPRRNLDEYSVDEPLAMIESLGEIGTSVCEAFKEEVAGTP